MTLSEFKRFYYQHGCLPNGSTEVKQGFQYQWKKWKKKQEKKDQWKECRQEAFQRNPNGEQFFHNLTNPEYYFYANLKGKWATLDPCHIVGRGECPKEELVNNPDNILIAPRYFHTYIDQYRNPMTKEHELISKEERAQIWIRFIGQDMWDRLQKIKGEE